MDSGLIRMALVYCWWYGTPGRFCLLAWQSVRQTGSACGRLASMRTPAVPLKTSTVEAAQDVQKPEPKQLLLKTMEAHASASQNRSTFTNTAGWVHLGADRLAREYASQTHTDAH